MRIHRKFAAVAAMALLVPGLAMTGQAPATTRYLVTVNRLQPGSQDAWEKLYAETAVPALKKAGINSLTVGTQVFGQRPVYIHVRPLVNFAELDGPGPLERAGLSEKQVDAFNAARNGLLVSEDRYVVNALNDLIVPPAPGSWTVRVVQFFRPAPGQGDALRALLRSEVLPAWRQAQQAGRIAGAGVANTAQGRPGLVAVWTEYPNLAALDAGNMLEQTMGTAQFALFQARLAQVGVIEDAVVMRRIEALSYSTN